MGGGPCSLPFTLLLKFSSLPLALLKTSKALCDLDSSIAARRLLFSSAFLFARFRAAVALLPVKIPSGCVGRLVTRPDLRGSTTSIGGPLGSGGSGSVADY